MTDDKIKVRDLPPTAVRLSPELRHALAREAAINARSLHAEIVLRLKSSIDAEGTGAPLVTAARPQAPSRTTDAERTLLTIYRKLSPEKQLALLSLLR